MAYVLALDPRASAGMDVVRVLDAEHELLADAIMRGAGSVRLLRRIVDPDGDARFLPAEVVQAAHETADLREGLDPELRTALLPTLERLLALFDGARRAGTGVRAGAGPGGG